MENKPERKAESNTESLSPRRPSAKIKKKQKKKTAVVPGNRFAGLEIEAESGSEDE